MLMKLFNMTIDCLGLQEIEEAKIAAEKALKAKDKKSEAVKLKSEYEEKKNRP